MMISGAVVAVSVLTGFLIYKVPAFHKGIPGFQSHLSDDYKELQQKNRHLERQVAEMDSMINVFSHAMGAGGGPAAASNSEMWEPLNEGDQAVILDSAAPSENDEPSILDKAENFAATHQANQAVKVETVVVSQGAQPQAPQPKKPTEILNLIPPVDGYITMDFNTGDKHHFGIDLVANENSLVRAVADGVVIFSEYSITTGYVVGIWHSDLNLVSFYKHNNRLFKQVGDYAFAGEAIGVIGNTGINSSGTHLHLELWYDNNPVNPADYIMFN